MSIRVIQWNVSTMSQPKAIAHFIQGRVGDRPTIACLDEVRRASYDKLVDFLEPRSSCFSLDLRMPGKNEGRERGAGVAVLGFGLPIVSFELMDRAVFPERTLSALLGSSSGPIRVASFHSLTGVGYRKAKASNFASIADYLQLHGAELDFLCFDANEPKHDNMDPDKLEFSHLSDKGKVKRMALIMGSQRVHNLSDSYVEYLKSKGETVTRDPLAVSYKTGTPKKKQVEMRYDYVMQSRRWRVTNCEYPYDESIKATSDHSAVIADFELEQG
jgi:endonuclease/exonuclease/phosphatase family metal-dependent hydrolase